MKQERAWQDHESAKQRDRMVEDQIRYRGVQDERVLWAMSKVPREAFVPPAWSAYAYEDMALPISEKQTISQPFIVATMTALLELKGGERVLEVGTGSGYAAAILGEIAAEVYTIERIEALADQARMTLEQFGYDNITVLCGDGTRGWPQAAPYDAIIVTACGPHIPASLKQQLKIGGRLVLPVGMQAHSQQLCRVTRISENDYRLEELDQVAFVPLIGEDGWSSGNVI
jgi:protein-L-isoaspartate(D-aspartate) O-methyltransferase